MQDIPAVRTVRNYELWMVAQLSLGFLFMAGAVFVLPPFVLSLPNTNPGDVGVVMALLPLVGLAAPLVAGTLGRFGSYRLFQHLGLVLFAVGFGVLALADELVGAALGALVLGTGAAFLATTNLTLMAESGLPEAMMTSRTSLLHMSVPVGQVAGLTTLAILLEFEVDFSAVFVVFALLSLGALAATAATNHPAAARTLHHRAGAGAAPTAAVDPDEAPSLGSLLLSGFGLVLLVVFAAAAAQTTIESQYPNFMERVFRIDGEVAAAFLALATLVSIPLFPLVGRWLRSGRASIPFLIGIAARAGVGLALFLLADVTDLPAIVPLAVYGVLMLAAPLISISAALLAASTSPLGPGFGHGGYGFALAGAGVAGAFAAGWAANEFGYRSLALVVAIVAGVALVVGLAIPSRADPAP